MEYKALATTIVDLTWLMMILTDLDIWVSYPPRLYCDNIFAIALTTDPMLYSRTIHIMVDFHFLQEKAQQKELFVHYILSKFQLTNLYTKPLVLDSHIPHNENDL